MHPTRRALTVAASALLAAFLFAGCGVSAGEQATSTKDTPSKDAPSQDTTTSADQTTTTTTAETTTTTTAELTATEQAMVDQAKNAYVKLGMDPDDAECLARGLVTSGFADGSADLSDAGTMMDVVNQCDIDMSELADLGSGSGLDSVEDGIKFGLETSLESAGLTQAEAECVADAFVDKYGSDTSAMQDADALKSLMQGCNVDPSKYGG